MVWIDIVFFADCHECVNDGCSLSGLMIVGKEIVFSTYRYWPYAVFDGIVVYM
ncbi:hypothetical protein MCERE19_00843 [Spirosomataceae bacterium]|jgi:hypothetical protein